MRGPAPTGRVAFRLEKVPPGSLAAIYAAARADEPGGRSDWSRQGLRQRFWGPGYLRHHSKSGSLPAAALRLGLVSQELYARPGQPLGHRHSRTAAGQAPLQGDTARPVTEPPNPQRTCTRLNPGTHLWFTLSLILSSSTPFYSQSVSFPRGSRRKSEIPMRQNSAVNHPLTSRVGVRPGDAGRASRSPCEQAPHTTTACV
jgi:hypothetical protein